jgi:trimeric autotransporter adhesin
MKILPLCLSFALILGSTSYAQQTSSSAPNQITAPIDESHLIALKGSVHPLTRPRFDLGPAPASMPTGRIRLILRRSAAQQQALTTFLADLQNPAAPSWHKWLTPAQFGAAYGISDSDLQQLQAWLQSHGLKIGRVPAARNFIDFSGTVGQLDSAFHTSIHSFAIAGQAHFANVADPQIPAALAPVIAGVGPLTNFHPWPAYVLGPRGVFDPSQHRIVPSLTLQDNNGTNYLFVDPVDAATIYDTPNKTLNPAYTGSASYDGSGITLGIVGVSDLTTADVANYRAAFLGESTTSANLPTIVVDGNDPGLNGAGDEALLDTEISGGIAPKAKIIFYTSADTDLSSGLFNAIFRALDDNAVSILSVSFQTCESSLGASGNQLVLEAAEQAAAQGITLVVAAGDNGSAGCDDFNTEAQASQGLAVNGLASTPYNIAVGGTDFDILQNSFSQYVDTTIGSPPYYLTAQKYIPEMPWNDSTMIQGPLSGNHVWSSTSEQNIVAGSGGASTVYSKPSFQTSLTPNDNARDLPDVALLAGNGFYQAAWVLCSDGATDGAGGGADCQTTNGQFSQGSTFSGVGGTSAAAPAFAGMLALVAQAHGSSADNYRLGQADTILYQLAQSQYASVFHDVSSGNNSVACTAGSPDCGSNGFMTGYDASAGYDLASGLGSVDAAAMVANWTSVSLGSTSTTFNINGSTAPYTGTHGASLTFNVGVTPSSATGVAAILDNANEVSGGIQNNGQLAIPLKSGSGSATYGGLPGGSYTVWARYGGDTSNAASISSPPIQVDIAPEDSSTALTVNAYDALTGAPVAVNNSIPFGTLVVADAQIEGKAEGSSTHGVATGSVNFSNGSKTVGTAAVSSGNQASWPALNASPALLPGGAYALTANYSGDASYNPSSSQPVAFTIIPAPTTMQVQTTQSTLSPSQSATILFTVYANYYPGMPPTGSASLILNNTVLATATSLSSAETGGQGQNQWSAFGGFPIQASQLQPGQNTLTVSYSGDSNYAPSTGTVTIDAVASGGGVTFTAPGNITLTAGTYGVSNSTVTLASSGGYTGWINWGCSATPNSAPLICSVPETHVPFSSPVDTVMTIVGDDPPAGTYSVTINGSDNNNDGIEIVKTVQVTVVSGATPALAVMNNGPLTISAGASTGNISNVSIIPSGGFTGPVDLSCSVTTSISGPQSAPTCSVPNSVTVNDANPVTAQLQVNTTGSTTPGSYNVAVAAASASTPAVSTTGTVPLTVASSPTFALGGTGIVNIGVGVTQPNAATVTVTPVNGFSGPVNLDCSLASAFQGLGFLLPTCTVPSSVNLSPGSPATVNVTLTSGNAQTAQGFYVMTISAVDPNSAALGFDMSIDVIVGAAPAFSLASSGNITVSSGATTGNTSTISVAPANGFTGGVNLTCTVSTQMTGVLDLPGCSLSPTTVTISSGAVTSTLTISTTASTSGTASPSANPFGPGLAIPMLAFVFIFGIGAKRRVWIRILGVLLLTLWIGPIACGGGGGTGGSGGGGGGGGGGGSTGTIAGQYYVTVTGKDAASGQISSQVTLSVTVQ